MQKFKFIPFSCLLLGFAIVLTACSQNQSLLPSEPQPALSEIHDYEDIGQQHNQILASLGAHPSFSTALVTEDKVGASASLICNLTTALHCAVLPQPCPLPNFESMVTQDFQDIQGITDLRALADAQFNAGHLNQAEQSAFYQLNTIVNMPEQNGAEALQQALQDFETGIRQQTDLSEHGRRALLIASSVMRYSETFWRGVRANGPSDPWFAVEQQRTIHATEHMLERWWRVDLMAAARTSINPSTWTFGISIGKIRVIASASLASARQFADRHY